MLSRFLQELAFSAKANKDFQVSYEVCSLMKVSDSLETNSQIDSYRIDALVAQSGMASTYRATDLRDNRVVALKVPHRDLEGDPIFSDRFQREAVIGDKLDHAKVMHVLGGRRRAHTYMVMEWCEGRPLRKILDEGRIQHDRAIRIAIDVLDALQYVHGNGVVHHDLKPENIMVDVEDHIKLIDFGIASDSATRRLTHDIFAASLFTPDYASPEQVKGARGDERSDIYSVGIILYETLTGKLPFSGTSPLATMNERLSKHPVPPRVVAPAISPHLQEVILHALERDPRKRYPTARDFAWDLEHLNQVGLEDRAKLRHGQKHESLLSRNIIYCCALALFPVVMLLLMYLAARLR
jgi:eukaryotic-like serine/threonine-protein kinase